MDPTIGRIVHYTLSDIDATLIQGRRSHVGTSANMVAAGQTFPAIVVRTYDGGTGVNLRVMLDGDDTYWATSRTQGEPGTPATWAWPTVSFAALNAAD